MMLHYVAPILLLWLSSLFRGSSPTLPLAISSVLLYLYLCYLDKSSKRDGAKWTAFQMSSFWHFFSRYFNAGITSETQLDKDQQYIFCSFPHGACTVNHLLTMTDCCGMLSSVHTGDRRDLCASVLFFVPLLRELLLWLGCVDASSSTAHFNLKRGRSILIFVGGEREQLLTTPGKHIIFLSGRKGFIKLALEYGVNLVPMYAFGENDCYHVSKAFIGVRQWMQQKFQIGIPFICGRMGTIVPLKVHLHLEVGAPVVVKRKPKSDITQQDVDELHVKFTDAMQSLFEKTKRRHGCSSDVKLVIL